MTDTQELFRQAAARFRSGADAFESFQRRYRVRERNRKIATIVSAFVVAALALAGLTQAFRNQEHVRPLQPSPETGRWTRIDQVLPPNFQIHDAAVGDQGFAIVGGLQVPYSIWFSPDGVTWTDVFDASEGFGDIEYGDGVFVANGGTPPYVWYSEDGRSWSPADMGGSSADLVDALSLRLRMTHAGRFFAWSWGGRRAYVWTSGDGRSWSPLPDQSLWRQPGTEIDWLADGPAGYLFGGLLHQQPTVWMSNDGRAWTAAAATLGAEFGPKPRVTWSGLYPIGIPDGFAWFWDQNKMITSADGVTWSPRRVRGAPARSPHNDVWFDLIRETQPSGYVTPGYGTVITSVDGIRWTKVPDPEGVFSSVDQSSTSIVVGGPKGMMFYERRWAWGTPDPPRSQVWIRLAD